MRIMLLNRFKNVLTPSKYSIIINYVDELTQESFEVTLHQQVEDLKVKFYLCLLFHKKICRMFQLFLPPKKQVEIHSFFYADKENFLNYFLLNPENLTEFLEKYFNTFKGKLILHKVLNEYYVGKSSAGVQLSSNII